jgi:multiple sugar transport system permease protein
MFSKSERRWYILNTGLSYKILLPPLAIVLVFIAYPMIYSVSIAFTDFRFGVPTGEVIWFQNFIDIFTKPTVAPGFYQSLVVTLEFTILAVVPVVLISLAIALLLNERFRGNGIVKVALLLPYAIPSTVIAVIWNWIYHPTFGAMNYLLVNLGIIKEYISVSSDPNLALLAILIAYIWKFVPYTTFLFTAGLATIPPSVYEAARMDNSSTANTFFKITIPLLLPIFQLVLVIQTIFALTYHFALVFIITQGGPGDATRTLPWLIFSESFSFARFGRGAAMAIILSLIMIIFIYVYLVVLDPERRKMRQKARVKKGVSHV